MADIQHLSDEGRGIATVSGKKVFISGALPGERVEFRYQVRRSRFAAGVVTEIQQASALRVAPLCPHAEICGGCSLQHMQSEAQIEHKQQVLLEQLCHHVGESPAVVFPPLTGPVWGYRRKARIGVKYVTKKNRVLVGFREQGNRFIADLTRCEVLHPSIGERLPQLQQLIQDLSIYQHIPQLEVAVGDDRSALVLRHMQALSPRDRDLLRDFAATWQIDFYLQAAGKDSLMPLLANEQVRLFYCLPKHDITIYFAPLDFTQVNMYINQSLVDRVLEALALTRQDMVLDLFCGIGNFSLPMARYAGMVTGLEGEASLVARATDNASANNLDNADFCQIDLSDVQQVRAGLPAIYNKVLLDPPRCGARELLATMNMEKVTRLVYVSCNIATLARDAQQLTQQGFTLTAAGVLDMFPHTAHFESIAVFDK